MSQVVAIDTETELMRPGRMAPRLVCLTTKGVGEAELFDALAARAALVRALAGTIVGHNVAFDMAVLCAAYPEIVPAVFRAYDEGRVTDTMLREQLLDIAKGHYRGRMGDKGKWIVHRYSLDDVARRRAGVYVTKTGFRLFYGLFVGVPAERWDEHARAVQARAAAYKDGAEDAQLSELRAIIGEKRWTAELDGLIAASPEEARRYAIDDAAATLAVYQAQEAHCKYLADQYRQASYYFALHLSTVWGLRTNGPAVEALREQIEAHYKEVEARLVSTGLVRSNGTRDTKAAKRLMIEVCARDGLPLRRTDAHEGDSAKCKGAEGQPVPPGDDACTEHVCLDGDACKVTEDPTLVDYASLTTDKKILSNDIEALLKGVTLPVHPSYGLAETGRTTCRGPNIQNQSNREGIRECFVPRPGYVYAQCDFPQLELYTLAQCCVSWLGQSKLAEALNAGLDPHLSFAARILGLQYDQAQRLHEAGDKQVDSMRKFGKVYNFGKPGGLGIPKLVLYAKKVYKVELTEAYAKELDAEWFATWPEMRGYFARVHRLCDTPSGKAVVETLFTQRVRGGASFCAACNNGFQALGSDAAKSACWNISKALYTDKGSALYNSRLVAFVHDEFILETPDRPEAHDAAQELARRMCESANQYLPDVNIKIEKMKPLLMRRWSKRAHPVRDERGRLIPWE